MNFLNAFCPPGYWGKAMKFFAFLFLLAMFENRYYKDSINLEI